MKNVLFTLLIVLLIIFSGFVFALTTGPSLGVNWSENDYSSLTRKIWSESGSDANIFLLGSNSDQSVASSETIGFQVKYTFTNAETSALFNKQAQNASSPGKDIAVRYLRNNFVEVTFITTKELKAYLSKELKAQYPLPESLLSGRKVYLKLKLTQTSPTSFSLTVRNAKVGRIRLPDNIATQVVEAFVKPYHEYLATQTTFIIDDFSTDNDALTIRIAAHP